MIPRTDGMKSRGQRVEVLQRMRVRFAYVRFALPVRFALARFALVRFALVRFA